MNKETFPIWKPSPNRISIGFSHIAFPKTVLPKDDHIDFAQEERLGLSYWTMILAICVVVDESKCLDIPIFQFLKNFGASSILTWVLADAASPACPEHPGSLDMISMTLCCCHLRCWWSLFSEYCIRSRIIFNNIASEYNSTFVFLVLCFQFGILQMTDVHQWGKMNFCALRPCFHRSPLFDFWLSSGPMPESFPISSILYPLLLRLRVSSLLEA